MKAENSGLLALAELRAMESSRLSEIEAQRIEHARARQADTAAAERTAAMAAEQAARAQHEAWQQAMEHQRRLELDEHRRVTEAAANARLEQQTRLRHEAQRLEVQMRAAQRAAAPRWPYVVVPALVAVLGLAGAIAWHDSSQASRLAQANAEDRTAYDQQMAAVAEKLDALAAKQQRLETERGELEQRLLEAVSEAERKELEARVAEIDRELAPEPAAGGVATKTPRPKTPRPKTPSTTSDPEPSSDGGKVPGRKPIVVSDGKDPLDGL